MASPLLEHRDGRRPVGGCLDAGVERQEAGHVELVDGPQGTLQGHQGRHVDSAFQSGEFHRSAGEDHLAEGRVVDGDDDDLVVGEQP